MKKTYITTMPDHIGAFLKASECFASLGINITRVSYNKAVDSHILFIDAEGSGDQLRDADRQLTDIGYIENAVPDEAVVLLEFRLRDIPGSVTEVLRLIRDYMLNISYISSQEDGSGYQGFKMGLFVEDGDQLEKFITDARRLCEVRVIDYNHTEKVFDNSIFYHSFVSGLMQSLDIADRYRDELMVDTNLVMQTLDEKGLSPFRTFESISAFANLLAVCRGNAFSPRITYHHITDNTRIILIEPPCGSNTAILTGCGGTLFIDSGYALYREEMQELFRQLLEDYDSMEKKIFITHADVDHCGLLPLFDEIYACEKTKRCIALEYEGKNGFREENPLHRPYISVCKILTDYHPVDPDRIRSLWGTQEDLQVLIEKIGTFDFGEMHFDVYEGKGGHLRGETLLIDHQHRIAFTGDVYINTHGLTKEQAHYNQYAPVLMTSVDTDPVLCAEERKALIKILGEGDWQIFGAHGMKKDFSVPPGDPENRA